MSPPRPAGCGSHRRCRIAGRVRQAQEHVNLRDRTRPVTQGVHPLAGPLVEYCATWHTYSRASHEIGRRGHRYLRDSGQGALQTGLWPPPPMEGAFINLVDAARRCEPHTARSELSVRWRSINATHESKHWSVAIHRQLGKISTMRLDIVRPTWNCHTHGHIVRTI